MARGQLQPLYRDPDDCLPTLPQLLTIASRKTTAICGERPRGVGRNTRRYSVRSKEAQLGTRLWEINDGWSSADTGPDHDCCTDKALAKLETWIRRVDVTTRNHSSDLIKISKLLCIMGIIGAASCCRIHMLVQRCALQTARTGFPMALKQAQSADAGKVPGKSSNTSLHWQNLRRGRHILRGRPPFAPCSVTRGDGG